MHASACNGNGCEDNQYAYDKMGRVSHTEAASPSEQGSQAHYIGSSYDLAGNEIQTYYGHRDNGDYSGITVGKSYDSAGRLSSLTQVARNNVPLSTPYPFISSVSYFPNGSPQAIVYGNGITETLSQNSRLQTCESSVGNGRTTFLDRQYFFGVSNNSSGQQCAPVAGNNGKIWHIVDGLGGSYTQDFNYDALNRITAWTAPNAAGAYRSQAFSYDSFGNLLQSKAYSQNSQQTGTPNARSFPNPGWTGNRPYDANNRLVPGTFDCATASAGDPSNPWYDLAGNVLCAAATAT